MKNICYVTAAAIAMSGLVVTSDASATTFVRRVSAMECVPYLYDYAPGAADGNVQWGPFIDYYSDPNLKGDQTFFCPIPNDTSLQIGNGTGAISAAYFWGYAYSYSTTYAYACIQYYNSNGGACGPGTQVTGGGNFNQQIYNISEWTASGAQVHVPYVDINIPNNNTLIGFYVTN